ncbi:MAG: SH3 domain-containing protein [Chloroflexota bacterium]
MAVHLSSPEQVGLRTGLKPTREETAVLPTLFPLAPGEVVEQVGVVLSKGLNVRLGAGNAFGVITAVKQGTELQLLGQDQSGRWLKVALPTGEKGWVSASFVSRPDAAVKLPVVVSEVVLVTATKEIVIAMAEETAVSLPTATPVPIIIAAVEPSPTSMMPPTATLAPTQVPTDTPAPTSTAAALPTNTVVPTSTATALPTSTATTAPTVAPTNTVVAEEVAEDVAGSVAAETAVLPPTATPAAIAQLAEPAVPQLSTFTPPSDGFPAIKIIGTVSLIIAFLFTIVIFIRLNQRRI